MPIVKINLLDSWTREEEQSISQTIHVVLIETLGIPDADFNHRILRFNRDTWQLPPGKSDQYVLIEMDLFPGRHPETKAALYKSLVTRLKDFDIPEMDIIVIINEPPLDNWGIRGGNPASQTELGYILDV